MSMFRNAEYRIVSMIKEGQQGGKYRVSYQSLMMKVQSIVSISNDEIVAKDTDYNINMQRMMIDQTKKS